MPRKTKDTSTNGQNFEVQQILEHRNKGKKFEYKILWKGYSLKDATWEPESNLNGCESLLEKYWSTQKEPSKSSSPKKKSSVSPSKRSLIGSKRKAITLADESESEDEVQTVSEYDSADIKHLKSVAKDGKALYVMFELKDGSMVNVPNKLVREQDPELLLDFYEKNLRFKS